MLEISLSRLVNINFQCIVRYGPYRAQWSKIKVRPIRTNQFELFLFRLIKFQSSTYIHTQSDTSSQDALHAHLKTIGLQLIGVTVLRNGSAMRFAKVVCVCGIIARTDEPKEGAWRSRRDKSVPPAVDRALRAIDRRVRMRFPLALSVSARVATTRTFEVVVPSRSVLPLTHTSRTYRPARSLLSRFLVSCVRVSYLSIPIRTVFRSRCGKE